MKRVNLQMKQGRDGKRGRKICNEGLAFVPAVTARETLLL